VGPKGKGKSACCKKVGNCRTGRAGIAENIYRKKKLKKGRSRGLWCHSGSRRPFGKEIVEGVSAGKPHPRSERGLHGKVIVI